MVISFEPENCLSINMDWSWPERSVSHGRRHALKTSPKFWSHGEMMMMMMMMMMVSPRVHDPIWCFYIFGRGGPTTIYSLLPICPTWWETAEAFSLMPARLKLLRCHAWFPYGGIDLGDQSGRLHSQPKGAGDLVRETPQDDITRFGWWISTVLLARFPTELVT